MKDFRLILAISIMFAMTLSITSCGTKTKDSKDSDVKTDTLQGRISLSGAFALYPMAQKWAEEFTKIHPNIKIDISAGGAGKGMADALKQLVDLGMFSREITEEELKQGAWYVAVTKDAVFPAISTSNPVFSEIIKKGLTKDQLIELFIKGKKTTWGQLSGTNNKNVVNVFTRSDACGAAEMWGKFLGKNQESLVGIGVFGDPGIAEAVKNDPNGIGFNNLNYVYDHSTKKFYDKMEVVPIDLNANGLIDPEENFYGHMDSVIKAIQEGRYPSPPARDLYFVSKGKPTNPLVIVFLQWILTDGQKFIPEAGYVTLPDSKIKAELTKLN
jgi:phosphate transport system substrate-binding protein